MTKIPRFTFEKFAAADNRLSTQMKSVGEVMAIGRTFQESMQKALRGLEVDKCGFDPVVDLNDDDHRAKISAELQNAGSERIWYVGDAFRAGYSMEEVFELTKIDPWFLVQIEDIILSEKELSSKVFSELSDDEIFRLKRKGFSDKRLSQLLAVSEKAFRKIVSVVVLIRYISVLIHALLNFRRLLLICTLPMRKNVRRSRVIKKRF